MTSSSGIEPTGEGLLIATDLDRTLLPNGPQPESPGARELFTRLAARDDVTVAYVSGRHLELVEAAIDAFSLPRPGFVIGDVGTTIYHADSGDRWSQPTGWETRIAEDWGGRDHAEVARLLQDIHELEPQPADRQGDRKLSYFVPFEHGQRDLAPRIASRLEGADVRARLVWSVDESAGIGLLDVLPAGASKLHALQALMSACGFGLHNTVFCGDSGNDLEVLVSAVPAVLVANALPDVRSEALERAGQGGHLDRLYVARGGFLGFNGFYSAGMLEGIAHYHPFLRPWLAAELDALTE